MNDVFTILLHLIRMNDKAVVNNGHEIEYCYTLSLLVRSCWASDPSHALHDSVHVTNIQLDCSLQLSFNRYVSNSHWLDSFQKSKS